MTFWESAIWFLLGAISFRLASYFLSVGYGYIIFRDLDSALLKMLTAADGDLCYSFKLKYASLKKSGIDEEKLKKMRLSDAAALNIWRNAVIHKIILSTPESFHKFIEYTNWDEAQEVLARRRRKEK